MLPCPACGTPQPGDERFCSHCGAPFRVSAVATSPAPENDSANFVETRLANDSRTFLPGTILANRYRMVALLGRGGMGEVYRADDLTLGQSVALKFLPREVHHQADRRERFLSEVRMALRVTHPHVCRVYDVGQTDGRHFLSMEYVDGEDLASLLRRIGRLPEDKAIEIARQLCAGLQAAHAQGVLHRDLKPANVMLDGRGRAKITDFGLAIAAEGISGFEARAGTPQYMAPEQIAGHALSTQTDIYALGLVLYEVFTGKPAFESGTPDDLERRKESMPISPSAHVSGLNPAIERTILRCLHPDPLERPSSAAQLANNFSVEDPLATAMAAGITPSPDVVAQAGGSGALSPKIATLWLLAILVGMAGVWYVQSEYTMLRQIPLTMPKSQMEAAARTMLATIGYRNLPYQTLSGFEWADDYVDYVAKRDESTSRWNNIHTLVPSPLSFWYRESPVPLIPANNSGLIGVSNPPLTVPGMTLARMSPSGHLSMFQAVPPGTTKDPSDGDPDWRVFFTLANLNISHFQPVHPSVTPPHASDTRRALGLIRFRGHLPKGGYDVPTDGRHPQAPAAPAIR